MEVVQHEHDRLIRCEALEQHADGAMAAVTLVLDRHPTSIGERGQGRKYRGELGPDIFVERLQATRVEPMNVLIKRIDKDPERQIAFQLGCTARENGVSARVGAGCKLGEKPGLADPGLPSQLQRCRPAPV